MDIVAKYFPDLTPRQQQQLAALGPLYASWNERINLISRKDIDHLYERHVLHSLALAKVIAFVPGAELMDLGTGGGFPGVPLAILFPEAQFHLVDSIGKKVNAAREIAFELGLDNVRCTHERAEKVQARYDFVVTRAVAPLSQLERWTRGKISNVFRHRLKNGLLCLKGGQLEAETMKSRGKAKVFALDRYFNEPYFAEKYVVHLKTT